MAKTTLSGLTGKYGKTLVYMMTGGLDHLVDNQGGQLSGFSVRGPEGAVLLVIRAEFEGKHMVCFEGANTGAEAMVKAHKDLRGGKVRWRPDRYA